LKKSQAVCVEKIDAAVQGLLTSNVGGKVKNLQRKFDQLLKQFPTSDELIDPMIESIAGKTEAIAMRA
jgi:Tfp pilus assembly protein PilO